MKPKKTKKKITQHIAWHPKTYKQMELAVKNGFFPNKAAIVRHFVTSGLRRLNTK